MDKMTPEVVDPSCLVCTSIDDWLREYIEWHPIWRATLSNGVTVYQDDDRPGGFQTAAWLRLWMFTKSQNLAISKLWVEYRGISCQPLPENASAFLVIRSCTALLGEGTTSYYKLGYVDKQGRLIIYKIRLPDLHCEEKECIAAGNYEQYEPYLIKGTSS